MGRLYSFAYKFLKSEDLAWEVVHDVFVCIWERREKLDPEKSFESYLFTIAKNKTIDLIRAYAREEEFNTESYDKSQQSFDTEEALVCKEIKKLEEETVGSFPNQRKQVYKMSREEYLTYDEIAMKLGISKNSVKTHLKLALKELRKKIEPLTNISLFISLVFKIFF